MSAIHAIVRNPMYRGLLEWNSRTEAKYNAIQNGTMVPRPRSEKSRVVAHAESDRVRNEIPELAIITPELWHRAQSVRTLRANPAFRQSEQMHGNSMLSGRIYCSQCGARMYAFNNRRVKSTQGVRKVYVSRLYLCSTYLTSGKDTCGFNKVPREDLDRFVLGKIRQVLSPIMGGTEVWKRMKSRLEQTIGNRPRLDPESLRKRLSALEKKIRVFEAMDSRDRSEIGVEGAFHQAKEEHAKLTRQFASAGEVKPPAVNFESTLWEVREVLNNLRNFDRLPAEAQKSFFTRFVQKIELKFECSMVKGRRRSVFKKGVLRLEPKFNRLQEALGTGNGTGAPSEEGPSFQVVGSGGGI